MSVEVESQRRGDVQNPVRVASTFKRCSNLRESECFSGVIITSSRFPLPAGRGPRRFVFVCTLQTPEVSSEHVSNLQYLPIGRPSQLTYHNLEDQWYHDHTHRTALSYASDVKHHPIPRYSAHMRLLRYPATAREKSKATQAPLATDLHRLYYLLHRRLEQ